MLRCYVANQRENQELEHETGPLEIGRGPRRGTVARCIVQDPYVSKDHVRLEEQANGRILVENLSQKQPIGLSANSSIAPGGRQELELPARLTVGDSVIDVESSIGDTLQREDLGTVALPFRKKPGETGQRLIDLGGAPSPEVLA